MSLIMCEIDETSGYDEFDPALDRLDQMLDYDDPEPDCFTCLDTMAVLNRRGRRLVRCPTCNPRPGLFRRHVGRAVRRQRRWERRRELMIAAGLLPAVEFDEAPF